MSRGFALFGIGEVEEERVPRLRAACSGKSPSSTCSQMSLMCGSIVQFCSPTRFASAKQSASVLRPTRSTRFGQFTSPSEACLPIMILPSSNSSASVRPGSAMLYTVARLANSAKTGWRFGIPEIADVGHLGAERGQRVGHDRAVAAEFDAFDDQLGVRALARRGADPRPEGRERGHPREFFRRTRVCRRH